MDAAISVLDCGLLHLESRITGADRRLATRQLSQLMVLVPRFASFDRSYLVPRSAISRHAARSYGSPAASNHPSAFPVRGSHSSALATTAFRNRR